MSPSPTLLPYPCGSAPFEAHRGSHLCGSGCRDVISPSEGVHAVSAQQCGFGRGVASGPQVSVALPALRPVAPPDAFAVGVADRVAVRQHESRAKSALFRCCASTGCAPTLMGLRAVNTAGRECAPF
jgi:hypothetical protein